MVRTYSNTYKHTPEESSILCHSEKTPSYVDRLPSTAPGVNVKAVGGLARETELEEVREDETA